MSSKKLKFLVDEDLPRSTAQVLKEMGFTALDVRDCGLSRAPIVELLLLISLMKFPSPS
jgi:hypothetical protein